MVNSSLKQSMTPAGVRLLFLMAVLALFTVVWFRVAWISDDALISMRTVLNFTNGHGPVFNVGERVQAYTHTLWFFALAGAEMVFGNIYASALGLSFVCSILAVGILVWKNRSGMAFALLGVSALLLSKAFMDYTSSGLEVPLTYLLLLASLLAFEKVKPGESGAQITMPMSLVGLCYLNRPDLIFFLLPAVIVLFLRSNSKSRFVLYSLGALTPVILWTLFSLFYYGNPFPNTALAKLNTGIEAVERFEQGLRYFYHNLLSDPITPVTIAFTCITGLFHRARRIFVCGILLNLVYLCYIGGDFMEGRFLAPAFFFSVCLLMLYPVSLGATVVFAFCALVFGVPKYSNTILSGPDYDRRVIYTDGIADERGFYYQRWGLLSENRRRFSQPDWQVLPESQVGGVVCGQLGQKGIDSGPSVSWIDRCALTDPVLARLPARQRDDWRIGHFYRQIPTNYEFAHMGALGKLPDKETRALVELVHSVVRGDLWNLQRLKDIVALQHAELSEDAFDMYRYSPVPSRQLQPEDAGFFESRIIDSVPLISRNESGLVSGEPEVVVFGERGLQIDIPAGDEIRMIHLGMPQEDTFAVFMENDGKVTRSLAKPVNDGGGKLLTLPLPARRTNYSIKLIPEVIQNRYTISVSAEG